MIQLFAAANGRFDGGTGDDTVTASGFTGAVSATLGGSGSNYLRGDEGEDQIIGGDGFDDINGNMGDDTAAGGLGDDWVVGDDTLTGGLGADIFHSFSEAGLDMVLDFDAGEEDRVLLDPGTIYSVEQVGFDVAIDMGAGNRMVLLNVQLLSLPEGWIFGV